VPIEIYPAESTSISWYKQIPQQTYFRGAESPTRFTHDYILLSQFYFNKMNPRREYDIHDRVMIMGDSGGYQILTQDVPAEPIHVLRWQEQYCDIGMTLDVPPDDKGAKDHSYFLKCLDRTEGYVQSMATHRNGSSHLKLLNVIQGERASDVEVWLKRINVYQDSFNGYAFPFRSGLSLDFIMWTTWRLIEENPKRIHLLSATGANLVPLLCHMSHNTDTIISVDSTSHARPAANHVFSLMDGKSVTIGQNQRGLFDIPCDCPTCKSVTISDIRDSRGSSLGLIANHNLYWFVRWHDMVDAMAKDISTLSEYMKSSLPEKCEYLVEHGSESFRERYIDGKDVRRFF
jgi:tRNA-guanine family transglycosylase